MAESKPTEIARIKGINLKEADKLVEAAKVYVNTEDRVDILKYIGTTFLKQDYYVIGKSKIDEKSFYGIDIIAMKELQITENIGVLAVFLVKVLDLKGTLSFNGNELYYASVDEDFNKNEYTENIVNANINRLRRNQNYVFRDLISNCELFQMFNKSLKEKLSLRRKLYLRRDGIQFKLAIFPLLLTTNDVELNLKKVPFPYHKEWNLYVIKYLRVRDLAHYLERKLVLLEKHSKAKTSIQLHRDLKKKAGKIVNLYSLLITICGLIFLGMQTIFQTENLIELLTNFVGFLFQIYFPGLLIIYISYLIARKKITRLFYTPYHKRPIQVNNVNFTLLKKKTNFMLVKQFLYECDRYK